MPVTYTQRILYLALSKRQCVRHMLWENTLSRTTLSNIKEAELAAIDDTIYNSIVAIAEQITAYPKHCQHRSQSRLYIG